MDAVSEARLGEVMPELAEKIRQVALQLSVENITIRVTQGLRTVAEQNALYAIGRTQPGREVTNAQGCESWHVLGCAVDVAPMDEGIPDWNETHPAWARIVAVGEAAGLRSGTAWRDEPHFELTGTYPPAPPQMIQDLFMAGGVEAVWQTVVL